MNWTAIFVIFSSIGASFSAMNFRFIHHLPQDYYMSSRSASIYRGLLLSYSPARKYEACRDIFSERYTDKTRQISQMTEREPLIADDKSRNQGHPQFSPIVGTITAMGVHSPRESGRVEDLFLKCFGKYFAPQIQKSIEYVVSSAFHPGLMYDITEDSVTYDSKRMTLNKFIGMSPEYVFIEQSVLETQYITIRQTISTLAQESSEYVDLIENRDTFAALSLWQKFLLCSSVISSPVYEIERSKFSLDWTNYQKNAAQENTPERDKKLLTFTKDEYAASGWQTDCTGWGIYLATQDQHCHTNGRKKVGRTFHAALITLDSW